MTLTRLASRKVEAFLRVNGDEILFVGVLMEIKRLDGYLFAHIFGQGQMDRPKLPIARYLHGLTKERLEMEKGDISDEQMEKNG